MGLSHPDLAIMLSKRIVVSQALHGMSACICAQIYYIIFTNSDMRGTACATIYRLSRVKVVYKVSMYRLAHIDRLNVGAIMGCMAHLDITKQKYLNMGIKTK